VVHGIADGLANQGMRAVHARVEAIAGRGSIDLIFLRVVKILNTGILHCT
jgi:hypothetical protein